MLVADLLKIPSDSEKAAALWKHSDLVVTTNKNLQPSSTTLKEHHGCLHKALLWIITVWAVDKLSLERCLEFNLVNTQKKRRCS